jgi:hypothetical protein
MHNIPSNTVSGPWAHGKNILDYDRWARRTIIANGDRWAHLGISLTMTDGPEDYYSQWRWLGQCTEYVDLDEWADGHEYSIDSWAKLVEYNVYGC